MPAYENTSPAAAPVLAPAAPTVDPTIDPALERRGYRFMVAASFGFAIMGVLVKMATETLPFHEVSFFRAFGGLVVLAVVMAAARVPCQPREIFWLLWRGVMGWASLLTSFLAIAGLHLVDAVFLNHTSPFFTVLLATIFLRERLTWHTIACLLGATVGVACVLGPQGGFWNWSALAGLASALFAASAYVAVKRANASNTPWVIAGGFSLVASVLTLPLLLADYHAPSPREWALLAGVATFGSAAQVLMTFGYRYARASTASIVSLLTPLLSVGLAIAFFGMGPTWGTYIGGCLILGSGYALFRRPVVKHASTT